MDPIDDTSGPEQAHKRSTTGCWTCRIRRKKCDEHRDRCKVCSSLRLKCDGYGPKPEWMDGGTKEKEKMEELKSRIRRFRKRNLKPSNHPEGGQKRRQGMITRRKPEKAHIDDAHGLTRSEEDDTPAEEVIGCNVRHAQGRAPLESSLAPIEDFIRQSCSGGRMDLETTLNAQSGVDWSEPGLFDFDAPIPPFDDLVLESSSGVSLDHILHPHVQSCLPATNLSGDKIHCKTPTTGFHSLPTPPLLWGDFGDNCIGAIELSTHNTGQHGAISNDNAFTSATEESDEFQSLTTGVSPDVESFLDKGLPELLPYLEEQTLSSIRERIRSASSIVKPLLHSTVTSWVKKSNARGLISYGLGDGVSENFRPIERMTQPTGDGGTLNEFFGREVADKQHHEEALILFLIQLTFQSETPFTSKDIFTKASQSARTNVTMYRQPQSQLSTLLQCILLQLDIIGSATVGRRIHSWVQPPVVALADSSLSQMTGCEPWVFECILEVTNIRAWKLKALTTHSLNIRELAAKAYEVEKRIEEGLAVSSQAQGARGIEVRRITEVYAHATEVYLHTTMSGAYPDVSDIRNAVSRTVAAIKLLSHWRMLRLLSWPVCVAASLAGREYDDFFAGLERGAHGDAEYGFKITRALAVAHECQRMRRCSVVHEGRQYDWFDGIRSLGEEWELF